MDVGRWICWFCRVLHHQQPGSHTVTFTSWLGTLPTTDKNQIDHLCNQRNVEEIMARCESRARGWRWKRPSNANGNGEAQETDSTLRSWKTYAKNFCHTSEEQVTYLRRSSHRNNEVNINTVYNNIRTVLPTECRGIPGLKRKETWTFQRKTEQGTTRWRRWYSRKWDRLKHHRQTPYQRRN